MGLHLFFFLFPLLNTFLITSTFFIQENHVNHLRTTAMDNQYSEQVNNTEWGYGCEGGVGPSEWGELSPEWSVCGNGKRQSPIRILSFEVTKIQQPYLQTLYHPAPATLINDGNLLKLKWKGGFLKIDSIIYELHEITFHTPSEHTINGIIYPLEMQMMHRDMRSGGMVNVAVLLKLDEDKNKFLDQFWSYIPTLEGNQAVNIAVDVNPKELDLDRKHYRYEGSLTTPPCTEGVTWMVMKKIYKVSPMQVDLLYAALKSENSRPVQPLNGRVVYKIKV
uniref:Alpha-carbonic anhydrase domain-containing protein n=1 Tax=Araucaria cunninghamii TaxID=56994 RepID=A0A0D6QUY1_ARACU